MNEIQFSHKNTPKWETFENLLNNRQKTSPDVLSDMFINLTDDLAYARTFYPNSNTTQYLNQLTQTAHGLIFTTKEVRKNRIKSFWQTDFPLIIHSSRKEIIASLVIFILSVLIGVISNSYDDGFSRIIMGDRYINMTLNNIEQGDPLAVYKQMNEVDMFLGITLNNIRVSFIAFAMGILSPIGVGFILFKNGVMLGTFQSFFADEGLLIESIATIWVHGTLEIFAIIIAGAAGLVIGNSFIFPKTYSRIESFKRGAMRGAKIIIGLIPVFIIAGFLESFVTRYTNAPYTIRFGIIILSIISIVWYFFIYPNKLTRKTDYEKLIN